MRHTSRKKKPTRVASPNVSVGIGVDGVASGETLLVRETGLVESSDHTPEGHSNGEAWSWASESFCWRSRCCWSCRLAAVVASG